MSDDEINKMKKEAEANAESDKQAREKVDKLNAADNLIFQTEKQLKDYGDKIPADKKQPIEDALAELKKAHESQDLEKIEPAMEALNTAFQAASQEMYAAQQAAEGGAGAPEGAAQDAEAGDDEVTDVDFEEVNEEKK